MEVPVENEHVDHAVKIIRRQPVPVRVREYHPTTVHHRMIFHSNNNPGYYRPYDDYHYRPRYDRSFVYGRRHVHGGRIIRGHGGYSHGGSSTGFGHSGNTDRIGSIGSNSGSSHGGGRAIRFGRR